MTDDTEPRVCATCVNFDMRIENGADVATCTHRQAGAAEPLHPHAQRTQQSDVCENICGDVGIFWKAKK